MAAAESNGAVLVLVDWKWHFAFVYLQLFFFFFVFLGFLKYIVLELKLETWRGCTVEFFVFF